MAAAQLRLSCGAAKWLGAFLLTLVFCPFAQAQTSGGGSGGGMTMAVWVRVVKVEESDLKSDSTSSNGWSGSSTSTSWALKSDLAGVAVAGQAEDTQNFAEARVSLGTAGFRYERWRNYGDPGEVESTMRLSQILLGGIDLQDKIAEASTQVRAEIIHNIGGQVHLYMENTHRRSTEGDFIGQFTVGGSAPPAGPNVSINAGVSLTNKEGYYPAPELPPIITYAESCQDEYEMMRKAHGYLEVFADGSNIGATYWERARAIALDALLIEETTSRGLCPK
jgi:hypothetical protein